MKVLVASKFWYRRGGQERVMLDEVAALEARGHIVGQFAVAHPRSEPSAQSRYFAPYIELGSGESLGADAKIRAAARMFVNRPAAQHFGELLTDFKPDLIHIHGIHRQISPSILYVATDKGIPVVQTLHDYHHVCPSDNLLRGGETPCVPPACSRLNYLSAISNACLADSKSRSALSAAETWFQRMRKAYEKTVTRFIAPSSFMAETMRAGGWKIPTDIVSNAVPLAETTTRMTDGDPYVLYAGRLALEKGVDVALKAAKRAGIKIIVAGEGPVSEELRVRYAEAEFVGFTSGERVEELLAGARAAMVPSLWFENASMSVLEAMAQGVPVVGTRMGGIPEQVTDGVEGILCDPGDVDQMTDALVRLRDDADLATRMGTAGRRRMVEEFSPEHHMDLLLASYERALSRA